MMSDLPPAQEGYYYRTFLVTCWVERNDDLQSAEWRFRLETPRSGWRRMFTTLEEVMSTIESELNDVRKG